ncbi:MAG: hypothetical protein JNN07_21845 [Verrucomicrobiales bacterium]|nr:hypothetical protein [Verrucomicrobiales bacterium]
MPFAHHKPQASWDLLVKHAIQEDPWVRMETAQDEMADASILVCVPRDGVARASPLDPTFACTLKDDDILIYAKNEAGETLHLFFRVKISGVGSGWLVAKEGKPYNAVVREKLPPWVSAQLGLGIGPNLKPAFCSWIGKAVPEPPGEIQEIDTRFMLKVDYLFLTYPEVELMTDSLGNPSEEAFSQHNRLRTITINA